MKKITIKAEIFIEDTLDAMEMLLITLNPNHAMSQLTVNLGAINGSGSYSLQAKGANLGSTFTNILNLSGQPQNGNFVFTTLEIDGVEFVPGSEYMFRMVDNTSGFVGPEVCYTVPAATVSYGSYYSYDSAYGYNGANYAGIGAENLSTVELLMVGDNGGYVQAAISASIVSEDSITAVLVDITSGASTAPSSITSSATQIGGGLPFVTGHQYQVVLYDGSTAIVYSNIMNANANTVVLNSVSNTGSGASFDITAAIGDSGTLSLIDVTAPEHVNLSLALPYTGTTIQTAGTAMPYVSGHSYKVGFQGLAGAAIYSNTIVAP